MNIKKLLDAIGKTDDNFIDEYDTYKPAPVIVKLAPYFATAVCAVAALAVCLNIKGENPIFPEGNAISFVTLEPTATVDAYKKEIALLEPIDTLSEENDGSVPEIYNGVQNSENKKLEKKSNKKYDKKPANISGSYFGEEYIPSEIMRILPENDEKVEKNIEKKEEIMAMDSPEQFPLLPKSPKVTPHNIKAVATPDNSYNKFHEGENNNPESTSSVIPEEDYSVKLTPIPKPIVSIKPTPTPNPNKTGQPLENNENVIVWNTVEAGGDSYEGKEPEYKFVYPKEKLFNDKDIADYKTGLVTGKNDNEDSMPALPMPTKIWSDSRPEPNGSAPGSAAPKKTLYPDNIMSQTPVPPHNDNKDLSGNVPADIDTQKEIYIYEKAVPQADSLRDASKDLNEIFPDSMVYSFLENKPVYCTCCNNLFYVRFLHNGKLITMWTDDSMYGKENIILFAQNIINGKINLDEAR